MRVTGFTEGAHAGSGGLNMMAVPLIMRSVAARGHQVILALGGPATSNGKACVVDTVADALARKEGAGSFGILTFRAWTKWAFAPGMLWQLSEAVRTSDFVALHSVYSFPVLAGYLLARFHRKPYGFWFHGVLAPFQRQIGAQRKWAYGKVLLNRMLDQASVLVYSARGEREEARCLGLKPPSVIVPLGLDAREFSELPPRGKFRDRFFHGHGGPLILFLARLNSKKGLDILAQAMARVIAECPEARLAIVGPADPPSFENRVREWIRQNGLHSVAVVTGPADSDRRLQALADADVFVLPSYAENFAYSVFEAMASRVPVVVSDTLNYGPEIAARGAGYAVARDPHDFAVAILRLLKEPKLRLQMGAKARDLACSYSPERMALALERSLESIVHRRALPADLVQ